MKTGNQYRSRKGALLDTLACARLNLAAGVVGAARAGLRLFWKQHGRAPASTRRRWKCGH